MSKETGYTINIYKNEFGWEIEYCIAGTLVYSQIAEDMNAVRYCLMEFFDG